MGRITIRDSALCMVGGVYWRGTGVMTAVSAAGACCGPSFRRGLWSLYRASRRRKSQK